MSQQTTPQAINTLKILWGGLFSCIFFFGAFLIFKMPGFPEPEANPFLLPIMSSMALAALAVAIFIPRFLINDEKKKNPEKFKTLKSEKKIDGPLFTIISAPFVVRLAFIQSVALFGFSLSFLTKDMLYFYLFASVSAAGFLVNFPSEENLLKFLED